MRVPGLHGTVTWMSELIVPRRFCGPPDSGNGGWTAGALATLDSGDGQDPRPDSWPAIEVSLRQPPPLDAPMLVSFDGQSATASFGGAVIAEAHRVDRDLVEVGPVDPETALAAQASYPGHDFHPFPTCFACGTGREEGDGLRIFAGQVADDLAASTWTPDPSLAQDRHPDVDDVHRASAPATWAALDCASGWAADFGERLMVLGRMTARLDTLPVIGERHVVVAEKRGQEGRKSFTASTLYDADGRVVATAEHIWISVDPGAFGGTPSRQESA